MIHSRMTTRRVLLHTAAPHSRRRTRRRCVRATANTAIAAAAQTSAMAAVKLLSAVSIAGAAGNTLPAGTTSCLSAAAFNVILPSFLMCSVGETIASFKLSGVPFTTALFVPCFALFQIGAGLALGALVNVSENAAAAARRGMRAWHPKRPAAAAGAIAAATAQAAGLEPQQAEEALLGHAATNSLGSGQRRTAFADDAEHNGTKQRIFSLSCTFGNTFTLPALILSSLLGASPELLRRAIGYLALYLVTWSPMLWGVGKLILSMGGADAQRPPRRIKTTEEAARRFIDTPTKAAFVAAAAAVAKSSDDAEGRGNDVEIVVATPATTSSSSIASTSESSSLLSPQSSLPSPQKQRPSLWTSLVRLSDSFSSGFRPALATLDEIMTPPLYGVFAGIFIGLSPLAKYYFPIGAAASMSGSDLPLEVRGLVFAARIGLDVAKLFGGGALATSTLVLALALFPSQPEREREQAEAAKDANNVAPPPNNALDVLARVFTNREEVVELIKVCSVRLVLLPLLTLATAMLLRPYGFFQDRVLLLCMLILSSMPSAQNMIIILNLSAAAKKFSGRFARMMMAQYMVSLSSTFVWLVIFQNVVGPVGGLLL